MKLTLSTGITVNVKPPRTGKAMWIAARIAPLAALPKHMPEAVVRPLYMRAIKLFAPYVTGVDLPVYVADMVLAQNPAVIDDLDQVVRAVLRSIPKRATR